MPSDVTTHWQPVDLGDGVRACFEVIPRGGREEVGVLDALPFDQVTKTLGKIAAGLGAAIAKAKPTKASIELGLELGLESGALVTLIARGTGTANLKVTLEWGGS